MIGSGLNVKMAGISTGIELTLLQNSQSIGIATISNQSDMLILNWIEIKSTHQHKGFGTYLLNHIIENYLPSGSIFKINVADEATLEFYVKFMEKRGINTVTLNQYIIDGEHHPEIVIPGSMLNGSPYKSRKTR